MKSAGPAGWLGESLPFPGETWGPGSYLQGWDSVGSIRERCLSSWHSWPCPSCGKSPFPPPSLLVQVAPELTRMGGGAP